MQNALLGFAIAVIVALIAALTAPHFMDWSRYRPVFEAELSRILDEDVRITGALDARLLPAPSLRLHGLSFGRQGAALVAQAESLDVEFSLGDLMRGAWRANELTIRAAQLDVNLDENGRLPSGLNQKFDLSGLAVDRLNFSGAIVLKKANDEAALLSLSDITFAGELRAMSGTLRGEGQAALAGRRLAYRLSSALAGESNALKLRLNVNADAVRAKDTTAPRQTSLQMAFAQGALAGDFDGVITLENGVPEYAGNLTISRPVSLRAAKDADEERTLNAPWRIGGKAKLRSDALTFESLDLLYGGEDGGLKMSGVAQARLDGTPRIQAVLSARQIDADRLLANGEGQARMPIAHLGALALMAGQWPSPPFVLEVQASADHVLFGGRPLRGVGLDLHADASGWNIQKLELQAPGGTNVVISGRTGQIVNAQQKNATQRKSAGFFGSIALDSADSASFLTWLGTQGLAAPGRLAKLTLRGDVQIAPDYFALNRAEGAFGDSAFAGSFAIADLEDAAPGRKKANVTLAVDEIDIERFAALAGQAGMVRDMWPYETAFDLRATRAIWFGQIARDMELKARLSPVRLTLERLALTNPDGISLDGSGEVDIAASTGQLQVKARAGTMASVIQLVAPLSPLASRRLLAAAGEDRDVEARLTFDVVRAAGAAQKSADARIGVDLASTSLRGHADMSAQLPDGDVTRLLPGAWYDLGLTLQADVETPRDHVALSLIGLDGLIAAAGAPAKMTLSLKRAAQKPFDVKAALTGPALDATLSGTFVAFAQNGADSKDLAANPDARKATAKVANRARGQTDLRLDVTRADISPLMASAGGGGMRLTSRIALAGDDVRLEGMDATIAGSRLRGGLIIKTQTAHGDPELDGDFGIDRLDAGPVLMALLGARNAALPDERWSKEPFGRGMLRNWRGRIAFEALAGTLTPGLESRPLRGIVLGDGRTLKLDALGGKVGGGSWQGEMNFRPMDGIAFEGQFKCENVASDAVPLLREAVTGRLTGTMNMTSQGRSPAALIGSLTGSGSIALSDAKLAKLNADAFAQAIARVERETDANDRAGGTKAGDFVRSAIDTAPLSVAQAEVPLILRAGRLVVETAALDGKGARLVMDGNYDLIASAADMRLKFEATEIPPLAGIGAPSMSIVLRKTGDTLTREVDPSAFVAWMTVRGVDRETRRLEALEDVRKPHNPASAPLDAPASKANDKTGDKTGDHAPSATQPAIIANEPSRKPEPQNPAPQNPASENTSPEANALPESNVPLPQPKPAVRPAPPRATKLNPAAPQGEAASMLQSPLPPSSSPPPLPPPIDVRPPPGFR